MFVGVLLGCYQLSKQMYDVSEADSVSFFRGFYYIVTVR